MTTRCGGGATAAKSARDLISPTFASPRPPQAGPLCASLQTRSARMRLMINSGKAKGRIINVAGARLLIGRDPECQLRPICDEVSRRHAELKVVAGIPVVVDLGSTAGTRLNGQRLTSPATVRNGDRVEVGPLSFTVLLDEP